MGTIAIGVDPVREPLYNWSARYNVNLWQIL